MWMAPHSTHRHIHRQPHRAKNGKRRSASEKIEILSTHSIGPVAKAESFRVFVAQNNFRIFLFSSHSVRRSSRLLFVACVVVDRRRCCRCCCSLAMMVVRCVLNVELCWMCRLPFTVALCRVCRTFAEYYILFFLFSFILGFSFFIIIILMSEHLLHIASRT